MKLLTQKIKKAFKAQGDTSEKSAEDIKVITKFFDPSSGWTWYPVEYLDEKELFFGLVVGFEVELGYFSLRELEGVRNRFGLGVERDINYEPGRETLADLQKRVGSMYHRSVEG